MDDFFRILQFMRAAAWAYDGALAKATAQIAEHRRYPRGFDAPDYVRSAIGFGEMWQRYLERCAQMMLAPSFLITTADGKIELLYGRRR